MKQLDARVGAKRNFFDEIDKLLQTKVWLFLSSLICKNIRARGDYGYARRISKGALNLKLDEKMEGEKVVIKNLEVSFPSFCQLSSYIHLLTQHQRREH
jgi:hypothetical protein